MEKQSRTLVAGLAGAVAALLFFGWLTREVLLGATLRFDYAVRDAVHAWASPELTRVMRAVTQLGAAPALITLGLLLVWWLAAQGRKRAALILVVAAIGAQVQNEVLKVVFRRPRPEAFFGYPQPWTYSFPSGHSVMSACFYGVVAAILTIRMKSLGGRIAIWTAAALLALSIGLSRVYLGVHYPSDVLAGYTSAIIWVGTVRAGYEVWLRRRPGPSPKEE